MLAKEGDVGYEAYAGIEVSGQSVAGTLHGFRQF
jgi:hypothetical protein